MPVTYTPFRYPGGKNALAGYLREVIKTNRLVYPNYVEAYCGGAGAALNLLFNEIVSDIYLNDIDLAVYAFWRYCLAEPENLCDRIESTHLSVKEWDRQRRVLQRAGQRTTLDLAFAALYLNRVNRSGILRGGLIGGRDQTGTWKMDARFNRGDLAAKIRKIARFGSRIHVFRMDALKFLKRLLPTLPLSTFTYLDPPYVHKGRSLYENHYSAEDHEEIARVLRTEVQHPWVVSYDYCRPVRRLYHGLTQLTYSLNYSAHEHHGGREIIIFGPMLTKPEHRTPSSARPSGVRLATAVG
jgi:DNA adenine methylase